MATKNKLIKNGKKQFVVRYQNPRTKKQQTKFFKKSKSADNFLAAVTGKIERGDVVDKDSVTLGKALDSFLAEGARRYRLRETIGGGRGTMTLATLGNYRSCTERHVRPVLGHILLSKLTRQSCQDLVNELAERHKGGPQKLAGIILTLTLKRGVELGWITNSQNPLAGRPLTVPINKERMIIPTKSELRMLADALQGRHYCERPYVHEMRRAVFALPLFAGLRRGEVAGLQWENLDFVNGTIEVRHSFSGVDGLKEPKSKAGIRDVPMLPQMRMTLEPIGERAGWPRSGYVLLNLNGNPIYDEMWECYFMPVMEHAGLVTDGLPKFRYHDLRHTFVSLLIDDGLSAVEIAKLVGHADVATTLRTYAHVFKDSDKAKESMMRIGDRFPLRPSPSRPGHDQIV